jgi:hypothetical protein
LGSASNHAIDIFDRAIQLCRGLLRDTAQRFLLALCCLQGFTETLALGAQHIDVLQKGIPFFGQARNDGRLIGIGSGETLGHDGFQTHQSLVQMLLGYLERRHDSPDESFLKKQLFSDLT